MHDHRMQTHPRDRPSFSERCTLWNRDTREDAIVDLPFGSGDAAFGIRNVMGCRVLGTFSSRCWSARRCTTSPQPHSPRAITITTTKPSLQSLQWISAILILCVGAWMLRTAFRRKHLRAEQEPSAWTICGVTSGSKPRRAIRWRLLGIALIASLPVSEARSSRASSSGTP